MKSFFRIKNVGGPIKVNSYDDIKDYLEYDREEVDDTLDDIVGIASSKCSIKQK